MISDAIDTLKALLGDRLNQSISDRNLHANPKATSPPPHPTPSLIPLPPMKYAPLSKFATNIVAQ